MEQKGLFQCTTCGSARYTAFPFEAVTGVNRASNPYRCLTCSMFFFPLPRISRKLRKVNRKSEIVHQYQIHPGNPPAAGRSLRER